MNSIRNVNSGLLLHNTTEVEDAREGLKCHLQLALAREGGGGGESGAETTPPA